MSSAGMPVGTRTLLVFGEKTFKITIPADAKTTFAPFSPPSRNGFDGGRGGAIGTLRVYGRTKDHCIGVFTGVAGFRDEDLQYEEQVAVEEGAVIWKSDKDGYSREERVQRRKDGPPVAHIARQAASLLEAELEPLPEQFKVGGVYDQFDDTDPHTVA